MQTAHLNYQNNILEIQRNEYMSTPLKPLYQKEIGAPLQVVQNFHEQSSQNSVAKKGELQVELNIYFDHQITTLSKTFDIFPKNPKNLVNYVENKSPLLLKQEMCLLQENDEAVNGFYLMKKNGYKIKITPFKELGFSMYDGSDLQITEKLEQNEDSFKFTSNIQCENLEVTVGFVYDIMESPELKEQIAVEEILCMEEEDTHPILQQQELQLNDLKINLAKINVDVPQYQILPESVQKRKNTTLSHLEDDDTTCDISNTISPQPEHKSKRPQRHCKKYSYSNYQQICGKTSDSIQKETEKDEDYKQQSAIQNSGKKGDKKNVVKNFVKAFRAFIQNWGDEEEICHVMRCPITEINQIRKEWMDYERINNYNNRLIRQLLLSPKYADLFAHFLQKRAIEWLKNSQVLDKKAHSDVLNQYIRASLNMGELDNIIVLKSRN